MAASMQTAIAARKMAARSSSRSQLTCTCLHLSRRSELPSPQVPHSHRQPSRHISSTPASLATTLPITGAGPPPSAPSPKPSPSSSTNSPSSSSQSGADRIAAHRRKTALLEAAKEIRAQQKQASKSTSSSSSTTPSTASGSTSTSPLRRRFWSHVHIRTTPEGYQVHLDTRPVRTPNKEIISIPLSKPALAHAVAIEWDMLNSAAEALKNHKIPMTSIVSRAVDFEGADREYMNRVGQGGATTAATAAGGGLSKEREAVVNTMMRYLDTDTLLCWAPASTEGAYTTSVREDGSVVAIPSAASGVNATEAESQAPDATKQQPKSLRELQIATAKPIIAFLTSTIWPGVEIIPTLDPDSIIPVKQPEVTREVIRGWVAGLGPYELAGLERAVLATKSLLVGVRVVVEWSEQFRDLQRQTQTQGQQQQVDAGEGAEVDVSHQGNIARFGIEEAARAASLEVLWQTGVWGEVEDTHDVEKEDVRRQLGSAVLVVSGVGN